MPQEPIRDSSGKLAKDFSNQARLVKEIEETQKRINSLQSNLIEGDKEQEKLIKSQITYLNKLNKIHKKNTNEIKKQTEDFDEMDDTMVSIGNQLKNNSKLAEIISDKFELTKDIAKSITLELASGAVKNNKSKKQVLDTLNSYKQSQISIANANKQKALGNITEEQRLSTINDANDSFQIQLSLVDKTLISSEELLGVLDAMGKEADDFAAGIRTAQLKSELMDKTFESFSGIPAMSELNKLIKTNTKDTLAFKAALFALGAVLAKSAYDYFGALDKIQRAAPYEAEKASIEGQIQATEALLFVGKTQATENLKRQYEAIRVRDIESQKLKQLADSEMQIFEARWEAQNAGRRAAQSFNAEIEQAALSFRTASKTALFGNGLGSVNYGAAQLQLAGIGAEAIAQQMSAAGNVMGKMPTSEIASDMAVMQNRTGQSAESIADLAKMFMTTENATEKQALNLTEGLRAMAESAKIPLDSFMSEISEASKDMLSYQIKSAPALAKQVAYAKSLGISFSEIAKAGQIMVLNYKDSIKSEMQLSALLGRQVDLSEVRAKFAAGDQKGALLALKAQGLNPAEMDMFQQQALTQATGIDLASLQKIATGTGAEINELTAGNAASANKSFLGRIQSAQKEQSIGSAQISANQAILDAQLSKTISEEYFKQISDITTPMGKEYKDIQIKQAEAEAEAAKVAAEKRMAAILDPALQGFNARLSQIEQELNLMQTAIEGAIAALGGFALSLAGSAFTKMLPGGGGGGLMDTLKKMLPGGGGTGTGAGGVGGGGGAGSLKNIGQMAKTGSIYAAAAAGFASLGEGIYNVASSDALQSGFWQTLGNGVANVGASFVNIVDQVSAGKTKEWAENAGWSIKGVRTDQMENARGAYRAMTGQQIGVGEESNQKLIDWVAANKEYLKGAGGLANTVAAFEKSIAEGNIKVTATVPSQTTAGATSAGTPTAGATTPGGASIDLYNKLRDVNGSLQKILVRTQTSADSSLWLNNYLLSQVPTIINKLAEIKNSGGSTELYNKLTDVNGSLQMILVRAQTSADSALWLNNYIPSQVPTIINTLTQIKNNDDIRGKLMYGQSKLQTSYLAKSFTRHHTSTSMQVLETQLTIMKQTRDLQEIAVEFLAQLLKKEEVSPNVVLDGKVLNSKLFDRGQRDRIIA